MDEKKAEAAEMIASYLVELVKQADTAGLGFLTYLIRMAEEEARAVVHDLTASSRRDD